MTLLQIAQITGTISIFLLFCIKFFIALTIKGSRKLSADQKVEHLVAIILWTSIYVLFLFVVRLFSLFGIGAIEELRVVSGFASLIPLGGVIFNLWMVNKLDGKDV